MAKANFDFIKKTTIIWQALGYYMERMDTPSDDIRLTKTVNNGFYMIEINLKNYTIKKTFKNEPSSIDVVEYEKLAQTIFNKSIDLLKLKNYLLNDIDSIPTESTFELILELT